MNWFFLYTQLVGFAIPCAFLFGAHNTLSIIKALRKAGYPGVSLPMALDFLCCETDPEPVTDNQRRKLAESPQLQQYNTLINNPLAIPRLYWVPKENTFAIWFLVILAFWGLVALLPILGLFVLGFYIYWQFRLYKDVSDLRKLGYSWAKPNHAIVLMIFGLNCHQVPKHDELAVIPGYVEESIISVAVLLKKRTINESAPSMEQTGQP